MTERADEPRSPFSPPSVPPPAPPDWSPATRVIAGGRPARSPDAPLNQSPVFASAYHAGGPVAYARDGNPTWTALEDVLGDLEGGTAIAFASGMAATAAVFDQVPIGGAIVVPRDGYYGTARSLTQPSPGAGRCGPSTSPTPTRPWTRATARSSCGSNRRPTRSSTSPTSRRSRAPHKRGGWWWRSTTPS